MALLLRVGFVPAPLTLFENLTVNDDDYGWATHFHDLANHDLDRLSFEVGAKSLSSNVGALASDDDIAKCLCESVSHLNDKRVVLMLSGGKDSVALAIALKDAGIRNVRCVTFNAEYKDDESEEAAEVAKLLGFEHTIVSSKDVNPTEYFSFLKKASNIVLDLALPSYFYSISSVGHEFDVILDGMGNDVYMGHVPPMREKLMGFFGRLLTSTPFIWGIDPFKNLDYKFRYLGQSVTSTSVERMFSGLRFDRKVVDSVYDSAAIYKYFKSLERDFVDFSDYYRSRALIRGLMYDPRCCMEKGRIVAEVKDKDIYFPFATPGVASILSKGRSFEPAFNHAINKIALRRYIGNRLGSQLKFVHKSKGSFLFDSTDFLNKSRPYLSSSEISLLDGQMKRGRGDDNLFLFLLTMLRWLPNFARGDELANNIAKAYRLASTRNH